ncbi:MAG: acylphosphatase [Alphaproteobacteria bacterium]
MPELNQSVIYVKIKGRVQGVWFRGWTIQEANKLGLSGWVRNLSDGSVEALFAGEEAMVNKMVALCYKGPSMALVTAVEQQRITSITPPFEDGLFINIASY